MQSEIMLCLASLSMPADPGGHAPDPPGRSGAIPWVRIGSGPGEGTPPDPGEHAQGQDRDHPEDSWVEITVEGDRRRIRSNGMPNHPTGRFPNRGNPNSISEQSYDFRIPLEPVAADAPTPVGMNMFGIALNGCFFEAGTAEWWRNDRGSGWHIEAIGPRGGHLGIDASNGHVQPSGAYHYHAVPNGLVESLATKESERVQMHLGWAADGYPIYGPWGPEDPMDLESPIRRLEPSWRLKQGARPAPPLGPGGRHDGTYEEDYDFVEGSGDLDRMNGRFGRTREFPEGTYHYVVTDRFPFVPRSWRGTPSSEMNKRGGPGAGRGGEGRGRGRGRGGPPGRSEGRPPVGRPPGRGPGPIPDRPRPPARPD